MYFFQIAGVNLPFAPESVETKINNKNETITLISEGEVNRLKQPGLTEISFTARIPQVQYAFASKLVKAKTYTDLFERLKVNKSNFLLVISRWTGNKKKELFHTSMRVSLEDYSIKEDAKEGYDLLVDLNFKQHKDYGVKVYKVVDNSDNVNNSATARNATNTTEKPKDNSSKYKVVSGDNLWKIARKFYGGTGSNWKIIYDANKDLIESTAKKYGKKSSNTGWWIYPGTELTIPAKK